MIMMTYTKGKISRKGRNKSFSIFSIEMELLSSFIDGKNAF